MHRAQGVSPWCDHPTANNLERIFFQTAPQNQVVRSPETRREVALLAKSTFVQYGVGTPPGGVLASQPRIHWVACTTGLTRQGEYVVKY